MSEDAIIRLGYDNAKVREGAAKTTSIMQGLKTKVGGIASSIGPGAILGGLGIAAAAGAAVAARALNTYGNLSDQAARLGTTVESIQKLAMMGAPSGADAEGLVDSLTKLRRAMGDPENAKAADAMNELGLSASRLAQLSPEDQVIELARGFQTAQATGRGFNAIFDLLGKSASNLIPTLRTNLDQLKELRDKPVLSEANAALLDDVGDKLSIIGQRTEIIAAKATSWAMSYFRVGELLDWVDGKMNGVMGKQEQMAKQPLVPQAIDQAAKKEDPAAMARQRQQDAARADVAADLAALQARANGHEKLARKIEEENAMRKRGAEIASQLGLDAKGGEAIAKREKALQDSIDKRASGKIIGGKSGETRRGFEGLGGKFEGLEALRQLQAGGRGERRNAAFGNGEPLDQFLRGKVGSNKNRGDAKPGDTTVHGGNGTDARTEKANSLLAESNAFLREIAKAVSGAN